MRVVVKYLGAFYSVTRKAMETLEISEGSSVQDLLEEIFERYGKEFEEQFYEAEGRVSTTAQILINGRIIRHEEGSRIKIKDGDTVVIMHPVVGGIDLPQEAWRDQGIAS
ncbi:MAG: MoaD family protein [Candidatus Geothermarchaeales archaeon]